MIVASMSLQDRLSHTGPKEFNLGEAQGRWTRGRGRSVVLAEVVQCGRNDDRSSKLRHVPKWTEFKRSSSPTRYWHLKRRICSYVSWKNVLVFPVPSERVWGGGRGCLSSYWSLISSSVDLSLPPHSVLRISLLFYEPLDLGPQSLQILLQKETGRV